MRTSNRIVFPLILLNATTFLLMILFGNSTKELLSFSNLFYFGIIISIIIWGIDGEIFHLQLIREHLKNKRNSSAAVVGLIMIYILFLVCAITWNIGGIILNTIKQNN